MQNQLYLLILLFQSIASFNLSPTPNIIISKQEVFSKYKDFIKQDRSSLFGFSINLRKSHVIISAPRAQPIVEDQKITEEPGAIFKCNFNSNITVESCYEYIFDKSDEFVKISQHNKKKVIDSETKDFQLLGFAMDGGGLEKNNFVVCAPHLKALTQIAKINETRNYYLNGLCSWVTETASKVPENYTKIGSLRFFRKQDLSMNNLHIYNYKYAESGFSAHVTENDEEVIIGCPGIYNWKGSVIRQSLNKNKAFYSTYNIDYDADVPSLLNSSIVGYSYFGYAVSSAKFLGTNQTFYVASAPRVNNQGLIYIFDLANFSTGEKKFDIRRKLFGSQYGEYFGYAVLCEDFNGDGLPDIAVSAPFYTKDELHDNGAVYVFINKGNMEFKKRILLQSSYNGNGKFGMSISKIGDINLDGYNDLLVSAPFEDDGAVYIFLGTIYGISTIPSQRIQAPKSDPHKYDESYTKPMFGLGLSRGIDIDGNGYNDLAVGAPNSEAVYIYRSYPMIRIYSILKFSKRDLQIDSKTINATFCVKYSSKSKIDMEIKINTKLTLDPILKRASVAKNGTNSGSVNNTMALSRDVKCINYAINIQATLATIFRPIDIKIEFDIVDKIQKNDSKFCHTCVMIDPKDRKSIKKEILFSTGCNSTDCRVDLSVTGTLQNVSQPFILGSENTFTINYEIKNVGEPAYSTQLRIEMSSILTQFSRIPPLCSIEQNVMECSINNKKPVYNQTTITLNITIDVAQFDGKLLEIKADISSIGNEMNHQDNRNINQVLLAEFSEIEIISLSSSPELHLSDSLVRNNVTYEYQIYNYGPSNIKKLAVTLQIPMIYTIETNKHVKIIELDDTNINIVYKNKPLKVTWTKSEKVLKFLDENIHKHNVVKDFERSELGYDYEMNHLEPDQDLSHMRKRSVDFIDNFNLTLRNKNSSDDSIDDSLQAGYPLDIDFLKLNSIDRIVVFDCMQPDVIGGCIETEFIVEDFQLEDDPLIISFNFSFNLPEIEKLFVKRKNVFIYKTNVKLHKTDNNNTAQAFNITIKNPRTVIFKSVIVKVPLDIYIISGVIGILILILILWGLKNYGFFERKKKVELKRLKRESKALSARQLEDWIKECEQMKF